MKTIIIANGNLPARELYETYLQQAELILCADGGANYAFAASIEPDFVIGDLDSIEDANIKKLSENRIVRRPSQYATDLEKTLQFALEKGVTFAVVLGLTGGRTDHQIGNLNILQKYAGKMEIRTIDNSGTGQFISNKFVFAGEIGGQVSIIAFKKAGGITTRGLKYPLINATMEWGINNGLSNEIVSNPVMIDVKQGFLFVFRVFSGYFKK